MFSRLPVFANHTMSGNSDGMQGFTAWCYALASLETSHAGRKAWLVSPYRTNIYISHLDQQLSFTNDYRITADTCGRNCVSRLLDIYENL